MNIGTKADIRNWDWHGPLRFELITEQIGVVYGATLEEALDILTKALSSGVWRADKVGGKFYVWCEQKEAKKDEL